MILGDIAQITIGVPDIEESAAFYEKLGFEKLAENNQPWPWKQYTDGQNLLLLNQDGNRYIGLNYISDDAPEKVRQVEACGVEFLHKQEVNGRLHMAIFADSDGLMAGLINQDPTGMALPEGEPISLCGKFGEFSLGVEDFQKAAAFWGQFGFEKLYASSDPYPWGIFSDSLIVLGLHQTDEFQGPCLTYFSPTMPERIKQLEAKGLCIENGVLIAPAGETILLFEGEV